MRKLCGGAGGFGVVIGAAEFADGFGGGGVMQIAERFNEGLSEVIFVRRQGNKKWRRWDVEEKGLGVEALKWESPGRYVLRKSISKKPLTKENEWR